MKLHEVIAANDSPGTEIEIQQMKKYKRSLKTYYSHHRSELILMVTSIFNACQYGKIVPASEFTEAIEDYLNAGPDMTEEDRESERENISFNSIMFDKL